MIASARAKYIRVSARKVRLVIELIKGKTVEEANVILDNVNKRACAFLKKVLNSAFANANHNKQEKLLSKDLYISDIKADGGPMLRRYRAATMGRAAPIRHRTAHIYIALDQVKGAKPQTKEAGSK